LSAPGVPEAADRDVIGYYVHHHGSGHRARHDAVAPLLGDVVAISELEIEGGLRLPSDVPDGCPVDPLAGGALHWAPLAVGAASRLCTFTEWMAMHQPIGVVVDVSVETTLACRLGGVSTVVVRQLGRRVDLAHELAYRTAQRLVAPWPPELDDDAVPAWVRDKTDHVGYVRGHRSPCDQRAGTASGPLDVGASDVVVLWGTGGGGLPHRVINSIASTCAGTVWCVGTGVVQGDPVGLAGNVAVVGWRVDIDSILRSSPVVVASAGNNVIADAARWSCPLVLVPQHRPFDEQHVHAHRLAALGAAVVVDGDVAQESAWPERLRAARSCADRLGELYHRGAAQRFADVVSDTFGGR
jgi:UDP-N-acetylglucosamine transferase subunit ALG13